jgi:hypothetical protein
LVDRRVEVFTNPTGSITDPQFQGNQSFGASDAVPIILDGKEIGRLSVASFLP